jgi:hypothetical protein
MNAARTADIGIGHMLRTPDNIPAAGKAGIALLFAFVHHKFGLPEPGR